MNKNEADRILERFPLIKAIQSFAFGQKGIPVLCVNNQSFWEPEYSPHGRPIPITFDEIWGIIVPDIRDNHKGGYIFLGIDGSDLQFSTKPNSPKDLLDMATAKFDITQDMLYQNARETPTVASVLRKKLQNQIQFNPSTAQKLQSPLLYLQQVSERLAVRKQEYHVISPDWATAHAFYEDVGAQSYE